MSLSEDIIRRELSKIGEVGTIDNDNGIFYTDVTLRDKITRLYRNLGIIREVKWEYGIGNVRDPEAEGQPIKEYLQEYTNGVETGIHKEWYSTGMLLQEGLRINGKAEGLWTWYNKYGGRRATEYVSNKRHGIDRAYDNNGILTREYIYRDGEMLYEKAFYENGNIKSEGGYLNRKKNGVWKENYEDGSPKSEGSYINDKKHGTWIEYHSSKRSDIREYSHGLPTIHDYEIYQVIGSGTYGTVYKIKKDDTYYAMKQFIFNEGKDFRSFIDEIRALMSLKDVPHVIQFVEAFSGSLNENDLTNIANPKEFFGTSITSINGYIISEYFDGSNVERCYIPEDRAIRVYVDIADTILDINSRGYIHGDIKGSNVLFNLETLDFCIVDLGLTCSKDERSSCNIRTTLFYEAPEISEVGFDSENFNLDWIDSFAYGVMLYEVVNKYIPYELPGSDKRFPKQSVSGNQELDNIIMSLIVYNPEQRITLAQARDALTTLL